MKPLRIGVIGSGQVDAEGAGLARAVGASVARAGAVLVCGGLGGVMSASADGAAGEGGLVLGVLPGVDPAAAAPGVAVPLPTGLGEARNVLVVRFSEALIAIAGGWGTLSEGALCRKFGKPLIGLRCDLPEGVVTHTADDPTEAVAIAVELVTAERGMS